MTSTALFFAFVAIGLTGWVWWYALGRVERAAAPLPRRAPLPPPSLEELADDMQVISPAALADIFRREYPTLPH